MAQYAARCDPPAHTLCGICADGALVCAVWKNPPRLSPHHSAATSELPAAAAAAALPRRQAATTLRALLLGSAGHVVVVGVRGAARQIH